MSDSRRTLTRLARPLLGLFASISMALALALWSHNQARLTEQARDTRRAAKNQIEQRLQQADAEKGELAERAALYREMQRTGMLGEESRLAWVETLQGIAQAFRVQKFTYEFAPQVPLDKTPGNAWPYFSSTLHLQFNPLHEEEFLAILAEIQHKAPALVLLRNCRLSRETSSTEEDIQPLSADCQMQWLTASLKRRAQ
jgi:hypothetical protein